MQTLFSSITPRHIPRNNTHCCHAMGTEAGLAPLRPDECLDLDLWDHIFDDAAVAKRSPLRTLARDMRAQLEVTPGIPPHVATRIRRHLPRLNHPD